MALLPLRCCSVCLFLFIFLASDDFDHNGRRQQCQAFVFPITAKSSTRTTRLHVRPEDFSAGKIGNALPLRGFSLPESPVEEEEEEEEWRTPIRRYEQPKYPNPDPAKERLKLSRPVEKRPEPVVEKAPPTIPDRTRMVEVERPPPVVEKPKFSLFSSPPEPAPSTGDEPAVEKPRFSLFSPTPKVEESPPPPEPAPATVEPPSKFSLFPSPPPPAVEEEPAIVEKPKFSLFSPPSAPVPVETIPSPAPPVEEPAVPKFSLFSSPEAAPPATVEPSKIPEVEEKPKASLFDNPVQEPTEKPGLSLVSPSTTSAEMKEEPAETAKPFSPAEDSKTAVDKTPSSPKSSNAPEGVNPPPTSVAPIDDKEPVSKAVTDPPKSQIAKEEPQIIVEEPTRPEKVKQQSLQVEETKPEMRQQLRVEETKLEEPKQQVIVEEVKPAPAKAPPAKAEKVEATPNAVENIKKPPPSANVVVAPPILPDPKLPPAVSTAPQSSPNSSLARLLNLDNLNAKTTPLLIVPFGALAAGRSLLSNRASKQQELEAQLERIKQRKDKELSSSNSLVFIALTVAALSLASLFLSTLETAVPAASSGAIVRGVATTDVPTSPLSQEKITEGSSRFPSKTLAGIWSGFPQLDENEN